MEKRTKVELAAELTRVKEKLVKAEEEVRHLRMALVNQGWSQRTLEEKPVRDPVFRHAWDVRKKRQVGWTRQYDAFHSLQHSGWREYEPRANFRQLMKGLGMTARDLALCYGVSRQAIEGMLERESRWAMRLDTIAKMAKSIECELVVAVRPKFGLSALDFRRTAAYKLKIAEGRNMYQAQRFADQMERGAKMDWEKWALMKRQGRL